MVNRFSSPNHRTHSKIPFNAVYCLYVCTRTYYLCYCEICFVWSCSKCLVLARCMYVQCFTLLCYVDL